ncbi:hypothetical protein [Allorhizobium taibaishanense]|uniref:AAA+ ATPase domain-containing protein n=1 Tax=Allorhizobium taibaishanense TaxID=887144 RepID=A0A1Q9A3E5_9HYPH|nr:hypothetical protein [Allorhizobium taibaishanense]MBB4005950.1 hypothetical protein [Allorhizobium taibaishanense]OLP48977.1 hypothetical protein BJF91_17825 [Allorhizobium taibaishanense]
MQESIKVRASRDGHQFHEQWAARVALGLLLPKVSLTSIALEGFRTEDEVGKAATEIADLVKFYRDEPSATDERIVVVQFKYSPTGEDEPLTAADLGATLKKFSDAQEDFENTKGAAWVEKNLAFEFASNRPIGANLSQAIAHVHAGTKGKGPVKLQQATLIAAFGGDQLAATTVLGKLAIVGRGSSVSSLRQDTRATLTSWYGASGPLARQSFLELCDLVRTKAGMAGARNGVITKVDVLGCLGIDDESELFPVSQAFPDVPQVIERDCFDEIEATIRRSGGPFLIHAGGGSGKTVLMQSLARRFASDGSVILFDGFGGGRWRMPGDDRHQCRRSLLHIVNELAARGLCDLMLPGEDDDTALRTARRRLKQAAESVSLSNQNRRIFILLDAIDHAGIQALAQRERSFAELLIRQIQIEPIDGVTVVASCRSERIRQAVGDAKVDCLPVPSLSHHEAEALAVSLDPSITAAEARTIHARAMGNPRCLDALVKAGRPYDIGSPSEASASTADILERLLREQFQRAISDAIKRGSSDNRVQRLLHAMALLPPPVPVEELSEAIGYPISEVASFFSDLFPLIETTPFGLIFRDEPTETLAIKLAQDDPASLNEVIGRLERRQKQSQYATRALPSLLLHHGRVDELVDLAFSDDFPASLSSSVAKRGVRLSRLGAAAISVLDDHLRADDLFSLLVEAARVSGGSARADRLVLDFPDLTALSGDAEALRRLFDRKTSWAAPRYGAMAIASLFSGDSGEADRNAGRAIAWLNWSLHQDDHDRRGMDRDWIRALFVFLLQGQSAKILKWLSRRDAYSAYTYLSDLLQLLERSRTVDPRSAKVRRDLLAKAASKRRQPIWFYAALLHTLPCTKEAQTAIIARMAEHIELIPKDQTENWDLERRRRKDLVDAALGAAVQAAHLGRIEDAGKILAALPIDRPTYYDLDEDYFYDRKIGRWIIYCAVSAIVAKRPAPYSDTIPSELWQEIPKSVRRAGDRVVEKRCRDLLHRQPKKRKKPRFEYETAQRLTRVLDNRSAIVGQLIQLSRELITGSASATSAFETTSKAMKNAGNYPYRDGAMYVAEHAIGSILFVVDRLHQWDGKSASAAIAWIKQLPRKNAARMIDLVHSLAQADASQAQSLELANIAREFIKTESEAETRIQNLALLAQVLWSVSEAEAGARFRESLELADVVGSDSQDTIQELISLLAQHEGPQFAPKTVHNITRLCELNLPYDHDKFDWDGLAKALARISGLSSIAFFTRLVDREKLTLGWALTPFLAFLSEQSKVSATAAAALVGTDRVTESWYWNVADYAAAVAPKLTEGGRALMLDWISVELDRVYGENLSLERLDRLLAVFHPLVGDTPAHKRLKDIAQRERNKKVGAAKTTAQVARVSKSEFRIDSVAMLDDQLQTEQAKHGMRDVGGPTLIALGKAARTVRAALNAIEMIAASEVAVLHDKLHGLEAIQDNWADKSIAVKDKLAETAEHLAELHAAELIGAGWTVGGAFRKLTELSPERIGTIVRRIIGSARGGLDKLAPEDWLRCAKWLSGEVGSDAFTRAVTRFADRSSADIPSDFGDPAWSSEFEPPADESEIVASFLWHQLGSPDETIRWRAAHALRRFAQAGEFDILSKVLNRFASASSRPFGDQKLPFYPYHARHWLLLALDRIASDYAHRLAPAVGDLQRMYMSEPDHVLLRSLLFAVLSKVEAASPQPGLGAFLHSVGPSLAPIGVVQRAVGSHRRDSYQARPEGVAKPADEVYLDYDFKKYQVDHLGRVFGVDTWQVHDAVSAEMRALDPSIGSMHECPRGLGRYENKDRFTDAYGAYLAEHALQIVAGKFLRTLPVEQSEWDWEADPWSAWLERYSLPNAKWWASDATDPFPYDLPIIALDLGDPMNKTLSEDRLALASLCDVPQSVSRPADGWLLSARWSAGNETTIDVSSILVSTDEARRFATALAMIDPIYQYVPQSTDFLRDADEPLRNCFRISLEEHRQSEDRIDDSDPYGTSAALNREWPTDWLSEALDGASPVDFERRWINRMGSDALQIECWGARFGRGRHERQANGYRVTCPKEALSRVLKDHNLELVTLVKAERYFKDSKSSEGAFSRRSSVVVVDGNGRANPISRISSKTRAQWKALDSDDRTYLAKVYAGIQ